MRRLAALLLGLLPASLPAPSAAAECRAMSYEGNGYTVCEVDPAAERLRLFLDDREGRPWGDFDRLDRALARRGEALGFAMNAGMYHPDRAPVGHYIEDGQERRRVIAGDGPGNFGLLPNGVFCIRKDRADVIETRAYLDAKARLDCRHATQSGPMLVIDGALHPRFLKGGTSRHVRNGVGTTADGRRAVFVISDNAVNFHEFGSFFRDALDLPQALYFDGNVSRLHAPSLGRSDAGRRMGPIVGTVVPRE